MNESLLKNIHTPQDLKKLNNKELNELCREIRRFLIDSVSKTGGHLASNLGVVELTVALHRVFNLPDDKIIWDVGHQSYVHKILTGRADRFDTLRKENGLSGFPRSSEVNLIPFWADTPALQLPQRMASRKPILCRGKMTMSLRLSEMAR